MRAIFYRSSTFAHYFCEQETNGVFTQWIRGNMVRERGSWLSGYNLLMTLYCMWTSDVVSIGKLDWSRPRIIMIRDHRVVEYSRVVGHGNI